MREKNIKADRQIETAIIVKECADCTFPKRIDGGLWQCEHPELDRKAIRISMYSRHGDLPVHCPLEAI